MSIQTLKYILYTLVLAFWGISCSSEPKDPMLQLSEEVLLFSSAASSEQSVEVSTNAAEWTAFPEASWIKVTRHNNLLKVSVAEQVGVNERAAEVKVLADGLLRSLMVRQSGAGRELSLVPTEHRVDQFGGKASIFVQSNYQDWTAHCDADWVQVSAHPTRNTIELSISENKSEEARSTTIRLSAPDVEPTIYTLHQDAILTVILPSFDFGISAVDIRAFEAKRHSEVIKIPDGFFNPNTWGFQTVSPVFNRVEYTFDNGIYSSAKIFAKDKETMAKYLERLMELITNLGFVHDYANVYVCETLNARLRVESTISQPYVLLQLDPKQPQDYPTFDTFPYGLLTYGANDAAVIEAYEQQHGGKLDEAKSRPTTRRYIINDGEWIYRVYYIGGTQGQKNFGFDNINRAVFLYAGEPFLTREFKALMAREGFELVSYESSIRWFTFQNKAKGWKLEMNLGKSIVDARDPVLRFNLFYK